MTDIQRENWEEENKDKVFLVKDKIYEVTRTREKLTSVGGYNRYTIQLADSFEDQMKKVVSDSNYKSIQFKCENVYAYSMDEKNKIENLSVGRTVEIIAMNVSLGSFWHSADICVVKGI